MNKHASKRRYSEASWRHAVVPAAIFGAVIVAIALGGLVDSFSTDAAPQQLADKRGPTAQSGEAAKEAPAR